MVLFRKLLDYPPLKRLTWLLWVLLLMTIPITSSPLVGSLTGRSTVSPLSGIPLMLLLIIWLLPFLLGGGELPRSATLFLLFLGIALIASILSSFYGIEPYLGQENINRTIRGLLTLVIGAGFYFVTITYVQRERQLQRSLRWIYVGGFLLLLWATIQAILIQQEGDIPAWALKIHRVISIREMHKIRVTGLAYEPSWLANQLVMLYLPLWLSSLVMGTSAFRIKKGILTVEFGLLLWAVVVLFLTFSRIGLVSGFLILSIVAISFGGGRIRTWLSRTSNGSKAADQDRQPVFQRVLWRGFWPIFILLIVVLIVGTAFLGSKLDARIARFFETDYLQILVESSDPVYEIARRLAYAERLAYWEVGYKVFETYPVLGVGLGNSGFFFTRMLPDYGYRLVETIRILNGTPDFPNPKNLWVRLLAETGIIGFLVFILWFCLIASESKHVYSNRHGVVKMIGLAGLLALMAQILEGFSLDTFALPQLWIIVGFVSVAGKLRPPEASSSKTRND